MRETGAMQLMVTGIGLFGTPTIDDWHAKLARVVWHSAAMARNLARSSRRWPQRLRHFVGDRPYVRLPQLWIGLVLYGLSGALQVRSTLGLDPWDVLHQGISKHTGLAIGTVLIIVGAVVLLFWIPLRQWPGLGTLSNVVLIGISMNVSLDLLPHVSALGWRIASMLSGVALCGVATGMYIGANLGPGPRDGLMTGLVRRTGRSVRVVRTGLELTVLFTGWLLGGTVGIGTVVFALAIGPLAQIFLPLFDLDRRFARRAPDELVEAVAAA
jgi:uncharacterized membrane protein YczE